MEWYRRDKEAVAAALQRGERPDLATTMASGPLDELVALHEELGIFAILDEVEAQRKRAGVPDELLLRTASDVAVCGAGLAQWSSRGAVPRASSALATGLGPGADPLREQWTASASRGTARGIVAVSS